MKKHHITISAIVVGMLAVLGLGVQTVYAAAYTSTQVSAHNTASDCWEIIDGKVYNLTAFISAHPGGQSAVIAQCGKDASVAFHGGPHGASAINAIAQYQVGTVQTAAAPTTPPPATTPTTTTTTPPSPTPAPTATPAPAQSATVSTSHDEEDEDEDEGMEDDDEDGYRESEVRREHALLSAHVEIEHATSLERRHGDRSGREHGEDD